jgi:hypothetical protein
VRRAGCWHGRKTFRTRFIDLSLVKFVARAGRRPLQIESVAQPSQRTFSSAIVGLAFTHNLLEVFSQQGTDRCSLFGRERSNLSQKRSVQCECNIGFHIARKTFSPILRATEKSRQGKGVTGSAAFTAAIRGRDASGQPAGCRRYFPAASATRNLF